MKLSFDSISQMTENEAREFLESLRWPNGPVCPHCGHDVAHKIVGKVGSKNPARPGLYTCQDCRKQFTVTVGTIFESTRIPLRKWVMAFYLMNTSKKGISSHQLHRMLGISYKSAWFMTHRIRESMRQEPVNQLMQGIVEADETYVGGKDKFKHADKAEADKAKPHGGKILVFALVERGGAVRAEVVKDLTSKTLPEIMRRNVHRDAHIMTDSANVYVHSDLYFLKHGAVDHSRKEWKRGNVHTNTIEGWFSLLKRGITGTFHHVSEKHLSRYLAEFVHRYNWREMDDVQRTVKAILGAEGKRLYYKEPASE